MSSNEDVVPVDASVVPAKKKKSTSLRLIWAIDATGQSQLLELDKHAIMRRVQISLRDLRLLDRDNCILCRERAIVLKLEYIKMIITAEEVLLLDPMHDDYIKCLLKEFRRILHVENEVGSGKRSWMQKMMLMRKMVALEAICSFLGARTIELETAVYPALDELTSKISSRNLDRVRRLKSNISQLTARVQKVRDDIERLMENDDDLAELYLSRKLARASSTSGEPISNSTSPTIGSKFSRAKRASFATARVVDNDVEEVEMLLEAHFFQINSVSIKLDTLQEYIDDTEDYVNIQLGNVRNQLIKFELVISSASICVSVYSLVAGILGMNIPNSWNNHRYMFKWVVSVTGTLCAILFVIIMSYARYQKLVGS